MEGIPCLFFRPRGLWQKRGKGIGWARGVNAMVYYLIICRSLTYAQRTAGVLERLGITAHIMRTPRSIAGEGCSHAVKISQRRLPEALAALSRAGLSPQRTFILEPDGTYQEVWL